LSYSGISSTKRKLSLILWMDYKHFIQD